MIQSIPWESLFGGMLLGVSAVLLLLVNGKVAGISGIINGLLTPKIGDYAWRLLFVVGMMIGGKITAELLEISAPNTEKSSLLVLSIAGLLVGLGARIGNGCTSGHGICGVGRLSKRSIIATSIFMMVAAFTVFIRLHVL